MIRNLKALGLAVVAVLAMSAVVASAASAETGTVTAESYPAKLTSTQVGTNELSIGNGARKVSCTTATVSGELTAATTTLTLTPTYTNCTSTGALPATVTLNGCDYLLHPTKVTATTGTGTVDVVCPAGKEITVDIYSSSEHIPANIKCEYHIKAATGYAAGEYHLIGAGTTREIQATLNVVKIHTVNTVGSKLLCGLAAAETGTSTLTGTQTLTGENPSTGAHIGVFIS